MQSERGKGVGRHLRRKAGSVCPYSPSCFSCPLPDCRADKSWRFNEILTGEVFEAIMRQR